MAKTKGSIVCISSICGLSVIKDAPVTYSTAKAALNTYVRSISHHLGKFDIRINAIAPGNIFFDGLEISSSSKQIKKHIQIVFQDPYGSLSPRMTIDEIVGEGLSVHFKLSKKESQFKIDKVSLLFLLLSQVNSHKVKTFSRLNVWLA